MDKREQTVRIWFEMWIQKLGNMQKKAQKVVDKREKCAAEPLVEFEATNSNLRNG